MRPFEAAAPPPAQPSRRRALQNATTTSSILVPKCALDALQNVTSGQDAQVAVCADASGYSFSLITDVPTQQQIAKMCTIEDCRDTIHGIKQMASSECIVSSGHGVELYLYQDVLTPVETQCVFHAQEEQAILPPTATTTPEQSTTTTTTTTTNATTLSLSTMIALVLGAIGCGVFAAFITMRFKRHRNSKRAAGKRQTRATSLIPVGDPDDFFAAITVPSSDDISGRRSHSSSVSTSEILQPEAEVSWVQRHHPSLVGWRIPSQHIETGALISSCHGGYTELFRGEVVDRNHNQSVTIQKLKTQSKNDATQIDQLVARARLVASLRHDKIEQFVGVAWTNSLAAAVAPSDLWLITTTNTNKCGGDLCGLLAKYSNDQQPCGFNRDKVYISLQIAQAVQYLHSLDPVVHHRNLTSRNIQCSDNLDIVVTCVGDTGGIEKQQKWMAPEVMRGEPYTEKADVFAFGLLLSELDTHMVPGLDAVSGPLSVPFTEEDDDGDSDMVALGRSCVAMDPRERPAASVVVRRIEKIMNSYRAFV